MLDDIEVDKIWLRGEINQSLDRLISQNYVARSGDTYHFLTDEEQEISKDIKNTVVDMAQITQSIEVYKIQLGPRGTGKSHIYAEISPYSILMSGGKTSVANLFFDMRTRHVGLVGH